MIEIKGMVIGSFVSTTRVKDIPLNNASRGLDTSIGTTARETRRW